MKMLLKKTQTLTKNIGCGYPRAFLYTTFSKPTNQKNLATGYPVNFRNV